MGGRKVCSIDNGGQVSTCIRDDEDCKICEWNDADHKQFVDENNLGKRHVLLNRMSTLLREHYDPEDPNDIFVEVRFDSGKEIHQFNGESFSLVLKSIICKCCGGETLSQFYDENLCEQCTDLWSMSGMELAEFIEWINSNHDKG